MLASWLLQVLDLQCVLYTARSAVLSWGVIGGLRAPAF